MAAIRTTIAVLCIAINVYSDDSLRELWQEHMRESKSCVCSAPVATAIAATDLAIESGDQSEDLSLVWQPSCSVLYRCAGAGCCAGAPRRECAENDSQEVTLVFYVKNALEPRSTPVFRELSVLNHTTCACRGVLDATD